MRAGFLLSNAVPIDPSLNSGKWVSLERAVRRHAMNQDSVIVVTGPLFSESTERIGAGEVAVPRALFKAVLAQQGAGLALFATVLPNQANPSEPIGDFAVSVDEVESHSGLDLFPDLPPSVQQPLEATVRPLPTRPQRAPR
ncbi:MAG: DNA/RNA non-specific endonuclease [Acidobacteria bacterium]|nr:DNA/RNA non-specific endonuclease [Acidobacteriota bacterium]